MVVGMVIVGIFWIFSSFSFAAVVVVDSREEAGVDLTESFMYD